MHLFILEEDFLYNSKGREELRVLVAPIFLEIFDTHAFFAVDENH